MNEMYADTLWVGELIKEFVDSVVPVYPIVAEQGKQPPYCVYRRVSYAGEYTKDGLADQQMAMELTIVAATYTESLRLASDVCSKLDGIRGRWQGKILQRCELINATEGWNEAYLQTLTFRMDFD